jgi:hypothetical protein
MECISRVTEQLLRFGDGVHKYYSESQCNRPCIMGKQICLQCIGRITTCQQHSRKYDHGKMDEPIPDHSHIYGGKWYQTGCKKWGAPLIEAKAAEVIIEEMPKKSAATATASTATTATTASIATAATATVAESNKSVVKKPRKPKAAPTSRKTTTDAAPSPYHSIITETLHNVQKEVAFPTYMEKEMEEICADDYEIEYVSLSLFQVGSVMYFRDRKKNKLYKRIKDTQIGEYIGRYHPNSDSVHTDIPDSDDEQ